MYFTLYDFPVIQDVYMTHGVTESESDACNTHISNECQKLQRSISVHLTGSHVFRKRENKRGIENCGEVCGLEKHGTDYTVCQGFKSFNKDDEIKAFNEFKGVPCPYMVIHVFYFYLRQ